MSTSPSSLLSERQVAAQLVWKELLGPFTNGPEMLCGSFSQKNELLISTLDAM